MNRHEIITFILQNLCLFLCSQCWGTRKQNGSGCRAPSSQHLFVFYTGEITGAFIPAFWLHHLPLTLIVILNHFTELNKKAAELSPLFPLTNWKSWLQGRQKNARFTAEGQSQPCVLISSLDAIVLSGKHMSSSESPKLSIDICQHILHHLALSFFSLSLPYSSSFISLRELFQHS